jgi:hypothetical protein
MKLLVKFLTFCALHLAVSVNAQFTHPMLFEVNAPASIEGSYIYGPQSGAGWGITALPSSTVSGELVWGYDSTPDSLVCDSVTNNYAGKIVMVRRGVCGFSNKILNVQNAGAIGCVICNNQVGTAIINMAAGTFGAQVTIPAVSISDQNCALIAARLAAGDTVIASFRKPALSIARGFYQYETPQNHIRPLDEINVNITNINSTTINNVIASVDITNPNGVTTTLLDTIQTLLPDESTNLIFSGTYTPGPIGIYNMVFKTSLSNDSIVRSFKIGTNKFTQDEQANYTWVTISDATFAAANYRFEMGNVYSTGPNPSIVKKATFSLTNGDVYLGQEFQLKLYELPTTVTGSEQNYNTFTLIGIGADTIDVADTADYTLITKPLFDVNTLADSVELLPNRKYMIVVSHMGNGSILQAPRYTYAGTQPLISFGATTFTDQLYMGGFGGPLAVVRLEVSPVECADSISITANNLQINAGMELALCEGDSITLTASGSYAYEWNNGVFNGQPFVPTLDGNYSVTGTDSLGCSSTKSFFLNLLQPTTSTIALESCDSYTAPDNAVYTNSGQYTAIIPNLAGCDSTINISLSINNSSSSTQSANGLDSYTWPVNGQTYVQSGAYTTIIPNSAGCDSTVTLNVTLSYTGLVEHSMDYRIYPNPTTDQLTIQSFRESAKKYKIVDALGRIIFAGILSHGENIIQFQGFARGTYSLIIEENSIPIRIVKE